MSHMCCNFYFHNIYFILFTSPPVATQVVRVGSRSSELAMIQSRTIITALEKLYPQVKFEIITMSTIGDKVLDKALPNIGQTNLFTKELEMALAANEVDMIVHSLKDLPTTLPPGMSISVIFKRDSPTDALVLHPKHKGLQIQTLPKGSIIGTSSLRRIAQLKRNFPGLEFKTVRGNLNTRLRKLDEGDDYDALVLATAGLVRMGWKDRISQELDEATCMYAVGQGALAIETRSDDGELNKLLLPLNDAETVYCCVAERAFLHTLGGGCSVPVGVHTVIKEGVLHIEGAVYSLDGSQVVKSTLVSQLPENYATLPLSECHAISEKVGTDLANSVIEKGAGPILTKAKEAIDSSRTMSNPKK